jgi:hypothetical protein
MAQTSQVPNPFMLMLNPEVVLAAVEASERLSQLNRHLCRPLDRPVLGNAKAGDETVDDDGSDDSLAIDGQ